MNKPQKSLYKQQIRVIAKNQHIQTIQNTENNADISNYVTPTHIKWVTHKSATTQEVKHQNDYSIHTEK